MPGLVRLTSPVTSTPPDVSPLQLNIERIGRYGGTPNQLLATSNQVSITKGRKAGWVAFTLPKMITLQAGTYYWIGLDSGATGKVARYAGVPVTSALRWNTDTYTDGAAATFGPATADSTNMSIFAG